jgi:hypothetical protein
MIILVLTTLITLILLVWFKSDAIVEWGSLLGLSEFLMIDEFHKMKLEEAYLFINYPIFLKIKYHNFIVNMLACPLCLSVWLSLFFCSGLFILSPILMAFMPVICIFSLILYGIATSLLRLP